MNEMTPREPEKPTRRRTGGRPETNMRALARDHSARALEKLAELMEDKNHCVALGAVRTLLERGYGKEPMEHTGKRIRVKPVAGKLNGKITHLKPREPADAR